MEIAGWRFCCMILYVKLIETPVYLLFRDKALWLFILGPFFGFVAEQHYVSFWDVCHIFTLQMLAWGCKAQIICTHFVLLLIITLFFHYCSEWYLGMSWNSPQTLSNLQTISVMLMVEPNTRILKDERLVSGNSL